MSEKYKRYFKICEMCFLQIYVDIHLLRLIRSTGRETDRQKASGEVNINPKLNIFSDVFINKNLFQFKLH